MEVITSAPSGLTTLASVRVIPASSSNKRPCMVTLPSSFFAHGAAALKTPGLRTSYSNRVQCHGLGGGAAGAGMNLFGRLARIIRSYANAFVSYFEDPEKIIDQAVVEMNNDLVKMRNATAQIVASQKQLEQKYKTAENASNHWYKRARLALQKGDEAFAREALKRRKDFADNQKLIGDQLDQLKGVTQTLLSRTRIVESKIREAKTKKDALKARAVCAKTATTLRDMVDNLNGSSALAAFERMEEKVMALEYQAELDNRHIRDEIEEKFAALEGPTFDDELENLKRETSRNFKMGELPLGRTFPASSPFCFTELDVDVGVEEHHLVS